MGRDKARLALGSAVALGWVMHDAAVFLNSGRPYLAVEILIDSIPVVLVAAAIAGLLRGRKPLLVGLLLAAVAGVLPSLVPYSLAPPIVRAIRGAGLLVFCIGAVLLAPPRARCWQAALLVGAGACGASAIALHEAGRVQGLLLLVLAAITVLRWIPVRCPAVFTAGLLLAPPVWLTGAARSHFRPSRPDLGPPEAPGPADGLNLLLVILDTVRADHLAPYGSPRVTTPLLDRWVEQYGVRYTEARSTSSWTLPSHASLFTGLLPSEHGSVYALGRAPELSRSTPTLAEMLRERGYDTGAVMANSAYLRAGSSGIERGFRHYDDRLGGSVGDYVALAQLFGASLRTGHLRYRDAALITDAALDWLDATSGPFFLALNYMDAHQPNITPARFASAFSPERPRDPLRRDISLDALLYDRELLHLDEHVGRLLRALESRGLLDRTVVIITSDHGEAHGEHGLHGHGWFLFEPLLRVPLYLKPAGPRTATTCGQPTTSADTFRLALEQLRIEPPQREVPAIVAELHVHPAERDENPDRPPLRDHSDLLAWLEGSIKYIVSSHGEVQAFDLAADPSERQPLRLDPAATAAARERARAWREAHPLDTSATDPLDAETLERLRELGYH